MNNTAITPPRLLIAISLLSILAFAVTACSGSSTLISGGTLTPSNGKLEIPVAGINDGKSHHFNVKADNGMTVEFFVLKSADGVLRAAIDSCDVCFRSGLGYYQEGDKMICKNCGQKFASNKINVIKGGCNPAPLDRKVVGDTLVINMQDINANTWYMQFRQS